MLRDELDLTAQLDDVDLLVDRESVADAHSLLHSLGFMRVPTLGRGTHRFYLAYDPSEDQWIKLDVVTELSFGPCFAFRTKAAHGCLIRRQRDGPLHTLAPDDAFWTLLLHCMFDKGRFSPKRTLRLLQLHPAARGDGVWSDLISSICPPGWNAATILDMVCSGTWAALESATPAMASNWTHLDLLGVGWRITSGRLGRALENPRVSVSRRGITVTLLGTDGVGKTTIAAAIDRSFPLPSRIVYMGLWQRGSRRRGWGLPGGDLVMRLAGLWGCYLVGRYHSARGRLVLFDRYSYDALRPQVKSDNLRDRLYLWILGHACPAPDLVLLLDAPGEVAHGRKAEYPAAELEADRRRFLALKAHVPQIEIVDARQPTDAVRTEVTARIWRRLVAWEVG